MLLKTIGNQSTKSIFLGLWMAIMPLIFSGVAGYQIISYEADIQNFGAIQWALVFTLSIFTMALALTPTTLVAITTGYFIGLLGLLPLVISYTLASIVGYTLARPLGPGMMANIYKAYPKSERIFENLNHGNPFWFVVMCRLSPILPFGLMNVVLSLMAIPFRSFLLGGIVGMLPRTVTALMVGKLASDLINVVTHPGQNLLMQISFTALLIISGIGLTYYFRKALHEKS